MLAWSIAAFARAESIEAAVVAAAPGHEDHTRAVAESEVGDHALAVLVVTGGASRSQSVAAALELVETELAAIHDAARPLVAPELIDALVAALAARPDTAGVIAATALTDTVKRARQARPAKGGFAGGGPAIAQTLSREHLWAAQTPQVFRTEVLRRALAADARRTAEATDDATLVEKVGGTVLIHPAPPENLKVTTATDLTVAEALLSR